METGKTQLSIRNGLRMLAVYLGAEIFLITVMDAIADQKRARSDLAALSDLHEETRARVFGLETVVEANGIVLPERPVLDSGALERYALSGNRDKIEASGHETAGTDIPPESEKGDTGQPGASL